MKLTHNYKLVNIYQNKQTNKQTNKYNNYK